MKFRSFVLLACMVVVPGIALFSHLTPPAARDMIQRHVTGPLCRAVGGLSDSLTVAAASPTAETARVEASGDTAAASPVARDLAAPMAGAAEHLAASTPMTVASSSVPPATVLPAVSIPGTPAHDEASATRFAPADAPRTPAEWEALGAVRKQLSALGATAIDCRLQPGAVTTYASSCRIGIDPQGQLHRMFHGRGPDAPAALESLVEQIRSWQTQQAGQSRRNF